MRDLPETLFERTEILLVPGRMLLEDGPASGMAALIRGGRFAEISCLRARSLMPRTADL